MLLSPFLLKINVFVFSIVLLFQILLYVKNKDIFLYEMGIEWIMSNWAGVMEHAGKKKKWIWFLILACDD